MPSHSANGIEIVADPAVASHIHGQEQWYGKDAVDGFLNRDSLVPWQLLSDVLASTYGAEVQLSDGTELEAGSALKKFCILRIYVTTTNVNSKTFKIQFWTGLTTFAEVVLHTEFLFRSASANERSAPIDLTSPTDFCNRKIWARMMCEDVGGKTLDFLFAVHTYDAPVIT